MSNSFDSVLLPPGYAYGFTGGPAFDTRISRMDGGGEQRVGLLEEPRWRWSALRKNFSPEADIRSLTNWFLARRGALYGFLFFDPQDFSTAEDGVSAPTPLDQTIGFGDGVQTRFKLRKQYPDPGGMTARTFVRRVVPLLGTATASVAREIGYLDAGDSVAPSVAVAGVTVTSGVVWLQHQKEVVLPTPPAMGERVSWGGYLVTPVRFGESTDQGLDRMISGFLSGEASFDIESIPFDDPVPPMPGGSPYGHQDFPNLTTDIGLSAHNGFFVSAEVNANVNGYLDDLDNYPPGGPHMFIANTGTSTLTVRDSLGSSVGSVTTSSRAWLFVREDASGNRTPVLL